MSAVPPSVTPAGVENHTDFAPSSAEHDNAMSGTGGGGILAHKPGQKKPGLLTGGYGGIVGAVGNAIAGGAKG